ncbi:MAG: hypothetical protein QW524_01790 [Candidatus Woesearchaeota archaeon]
MSISGRKKLEDFLSYYESKLYSSYKKYTFGTLANLAFSFLPGYGLAPQTILTYTNKRQLENLELDDDFNFYSKINYIAIPFGFLLYYSVGKELNYSNIASILLGIQGSLAFKDLFVYPFVRGSSHIAGLVDKIKEIKKEIKERNKFR